MEEWTDEEWLRVMANVPPYHTKARVEQWIYGWRERYQRALLAGAFRRLASKRELDAMAQAAYEWGGCPSCSSVPWEKLYPEEREFWRALIKQLKEMGL
jgi:hypothetical protein